MDCQLSEEEIIFIIENVFYLKIVKSKLHTGFNGRSSTDYSIRKI